MIWDAPVILKFSERGQGAKSSMEERDRRGGGGVLETQRKKQFSLAGFTPPREGPNTSTGIFLAHPNLEPPGGGPHIMRQKTWGGIDGGVGWSLQACSRKITANRSRYTSHAL